MSWENEPDKAAWLVAFVPGHSQAECIEAFEAEFGIRLSVSQVKNFKTRYGVRSGTTGGRFEPGKAPSNKGRKWADYMAEDAQERVRAVLASGRAKGLRTRPIGAESVRDGAVYVKVAMRPTGRAAHDNWVPRARLVWERGRGPVPEGHKVVHVDRDPSNDDLGNLAVVSNGDWAQLCCMGNPYRDQETFRAALALARLRRGVADAGRRAKKKPRGA